VIGTAIPGAAIEVRKHENGWIHFVDPSSGNSGWIQSKLVTEANRPREANRPTQAAFEEAQTPQETRPVKKAKKAKVTPRRSKLGQRFADLPGDEDFLTERNTRRKGLWARHRMLREGLMSPGFQPPR
jgi:hypothetical protein